MSTSTLAPAPALPAFGVLLSLAVTALRPDDIIALGSSFGTVVRVTDPYRGTYGENEATLTLTPYGGGETYSLPLLADAKYPVIRDGGAA